VALLALMRLGHQVGLQEPVGADGQDNSHWIRGWKLNGLLHSLSAGHDTAWPLEERVHVMFRSGVDPVRLIILATALEASPRPQADLIPHPAGVLMHHPKSTRPSRIARPCPHPYPPTPCTGSTDCTSFQHWQSLLLLESAARVGQRGVITRVS
jgi:hypothetical protein